MACPVAALLLLPLLSCGRSGPPAPVPGARPAVAKGPSNVARSDYAGSAACAPCHPNETRAWESSPMRRMTRDAAHAEVRAPFDGTRFPFKDDAAVLETRGGERVVRLEVRGAPSRTYRVTRVIGGRTREDFAGVDLAGGGEEVVLPVSFVYATGALRYKGYSVMIHERATLRAGPVWSQTCIFCHNTVPEMDRLLGAVAGKGAHPYQGTLVDTWLPPARRAQVRVTDDDAFGVSLRDEVARLGGRSIAGHDARAAARAAIDAVRGGFDGSQVLELGIGCEACHGGSRAHAGDPSLLPSYEPVAPWLAVDPPAPSRAQSINRACARCHQVLFSKYPYTWEGGHRDATAGGSHIASGEGRDFLLGACSRAMACTACHDPHAADARQALDRLATPAGNGTCTRCHGELTSPGALRAHAHHDPAGDGASCVGCHLPRKNMGLDGRLTRYHRIGSPTDPARVLGDRPLECALCHADKTVAQLVDTMEAWWPVRYPRQRLREMYGELDANVLRATLERGRAHEQAVAIATLADAGARDAIPLVARQLANDYPLVREWARHALERLGAPVVPAPAPPPGTDEDAED